MMMPPRIVPKSWAAGLNTEPEDGEGELLVKLTFDMSEEHKQALKDWMQWLMELDPAWGGSP
jgi:hypothetical protein